MRFPEDFRQGELLGGFLKKIRKAQKTDLLFRLKPQYSTISGINDYSKKYHHDQNAGGADREPVIDAELKPYVEQTLEVVRGT
jgi:hypothetical protein